MQHESVLEAWIFETGRDWQRRDMQNSTLLVSIRTTAIAVPIAIGPQTSGTCPETGGSYHEQLKLVIFGKQARNAGFSAIHDSNPTIQLF